jgi:hypothetical protein
MTILKGLFGKKHSVSSLETTIARAIQDDKSIEAGKLFNQLVATIRNGNGVPRIVAVDSKKAKDGLVWIMFALKVLEDFPPASKQHAEETVALLSDADGEVICPISGILSCLMSVITFVERFPDLAIRKNFPQKVAPSIDAMVSSLPKDVFVFLR